MKKTGNRKVHLIAPVLVIMLLLALTVTLSRARIGPLAAAQTPTPAKAGVVCPCGGKLVTALVRELRTSGELVLEHETEKITARLMGVRFPQEVSLPRTLSDTWAGRMAHVCFFPETELVVVFHEEGGPTLNQEVVRFGMAASDTRTGMTKCAELSPYLPTNLTSTTSIPAPKPTIDSSLSPCDCSRAVECVDFQTREEAQACYNACADYRFTALDPDHDGFACEELP